MIVVYGRSLGDDVSGREKAVEGGEVGAINLEIGSDRHQSLGHTHSSYIRHPYFSVIKVLRVFFVPHLSSYMNYLHVIHRYEK